MRPAERERARIVGIDAARALAIVGMVMVHIGPTGEEGVGGWGYGLSHGRASVLFVLLAGVGVSLLTGGRAGERIRSARVKLAYRAGILLLLGLALQPLEHGVLVILQYYALYFVVGAAALDLSDRALLGVSLGTFLVGPLVYLSAWQLWPGWFDADPTAITDPVHVIARQLVLAGSYPAVTWSAPVLFGMWLGRQHLRRPSLQRRLIVLGGLVGVVAWAISVALTTFLCDPQAEPSWRQLVTDDAHSQMPLWLIGATGTAVLLLGVCLRLGSRLPRAVWPLAASGQLALTVYVGHLLVLAWWSDLLLRDEVGAAAAVVVAFTAAMAAFAVVWRWRFRRGPLEAVLRLV